VATAKLKAGQSLEAAIEKRTTLIATVPGNPDLVPRGLSHWPLSSASSLSLTTFAGGGVQNETAAN